MTLFFFLFLSYLFFFCYTNFVNFSSLYCSLHKITLKGIDRSPVTFCQSFTLEISRFSSLYIRIFQILEFLFFSIRIERQYPPPRRPSFSSSFCFTTYSLLTILPHNFPNFVSSYFFFFLPFRLKFRIFFF